VSVTTQPAPTLRLLVTKTVLWFVVGVAAVVTYVRYTQGLGATTALSDRTPWGLWIGFDVLSGVALAAGGFVIAATVYIFQRERYHALARPAVLTAFLGYIAVVLGLMIDLGKPWNIWRPLVSGNFHSPLFEVAMCVMAYSAVLALEFAPVGLENFGWARGIVRFLKKATLPLVVLGVCLSTLHQSSLGTLFLLVEMRLNPLWFSPMLPLLFFVSAVGLGLGVVTLEGLVSSWLYRREPEWRQLSGLARAAVVVLTLYVALRLGDLAVRWQIAHAWQDGWYAVLFWIELGMSAIVPALLFGVPLLRRRAGRAGHVGSDDTDGTDDTDGMPAIPTWAIRAGATLIVAGFILHRVNVGGIAHTGLTGTGYVPALSELAVSLGIVAVMGLIFLFCLEKLRVWEEPPVAADAHALPPVDPMSAQYLGAPWFAGPQRTVLAVIVGVVAGIVLMEAQLASRAHSDTRPATAPRQVRLTRTARTDGAFHTLQLAGVSREESNTTSAARVATPGFASVSGAAARQSAERTGLLISGSGSLPLVAFDHAAHQGRLDGEESCVRCHHRNVPLAQGTSCAHCHADVYRPTDTFAHQSHVEAHGGSAGCATCHVDPAAPKTRAGSRACDSCHVPAARIVGVTQVIAAEHPGIAPGYKSALHGLCIACHAVEEAELAETDRFLSTCAGCHRIDPQRVRDGARPTAAASRDVAALAPPASDGGRRSP